MIPFGRCETVLRAGRQEFRWAAPHEAFFIPAGEWVEAESNSGAFLRLDIVEQALLRTAAGMAGLDDAVLRTVVMMLRPDLFFTPTWASPAARGFKLDSLLEQIEANLDRRVTLAELEVWSGRTARAIQLAFQKRFGIGPMQWVRERRLERVRERLLAAEPGATVRQIAAACGMPRMATLVPEYSRRFGELPSETLRRGS